MAGGFYTLYIIIVHPAKDWIHKTMQTNFYWKGMKNDIVKYYKTCHICQKAKKTNKLKHVFVPEKEEVVTKFGTVLMSISGNRNQL